MTRSQTKTLPYIVGSGVWGKRKRVECKWAIFECCMSLEYALETCDFEMRLALEKESWIEEVYKIFSTKLKGFSVAINTARNCKTKY